MVSVLVTLLNPWFWGEKAVATQRESQMTKKWCLQ